MTILNNGNGQIACLQYFQQLALNSAVISTLLSPPKILEDYIIFDNIYKAEGAEAKQSKNEFRRYNSHKACLKSDFKFKNVTNCISHLLILLVSDFILLWNKRVNADLQF
uniref:Uncharacterized protein n=1 Tax=Micrurus lemniscatus lemniscatus TaxID=129467 RepID=A0A2D4JCK1_MICLE